MDTFELNTNLGKITGIEREHSYVFLGIPYATANRFEYAEPVKELGNFDATKHGKVCIQTRTYFPNLDNPARYFYYHEFREGLNYSYGEDCLNLNIFMPKLVNKKCPVILYFHGGSFNSGSNYDTAFDGDRFAEKDVITVFANYRVDIFGYMTHEEIFKKYGRDGNFGLDDQQKALEWVKENIAQFGGLPDNITVMGQSAGAIATQYLCLNPDNADKIKNAIMMSGGGKFPEFALPKKAEITRKYWLNFMNYADIKNFDELKTTDAKILMEKLVEFKKTRKDNMYMIMPVIDGVLLPKPVKELIKTPLEIRYLLGYTNSDMYAPLMAHIEHKYARKNKAFIYYFDINPKGDNSKAFHSSDIRFAFNSLDKSWRPFEEDDYAAAETFQSYLANFAYCGDPNGLDDDLSIRNLPFWQYGGKRAMHIKSGKFKMTGKHYFKMLKNMLSELNLIK